MKYRFLDKNVSLPFQIVIWIFALYIVFGSHVIEHGYDKLIQDQGLVGYFDSLGLPVFAMLAAGFVEVFGSLMLFIPRLSFYGAVPLVVVMATAGYYSHGDSLALIAGFLALVIAIISRPSFLRKKPLITKISI